MSGHHHYSRQFQVELHERHSSARMGRRQQRISETKKAMGGMFVLVGAIAVDVLVMTQGLLAQFSNSVLRTKFRVWGRL